MIRLLTAVLLFASFNAVAEVTLTDINNNEVADADEVMGNFNALKQGVEANATALQGLIEPNQLCGTGFSCLSGTYDYRYGSDAEAEWWGRPNANPNCGFGATGAFLYLLDSKWVLGTGLGGSSGVIATCNADTFVNHPTQCGSNWEDANGPIEASFSSGSCGDQKLSDLNCGHDQIIKREGSAWVCSDMSSSSTGIAWHSQYSRPPEASQPAYATFQILERVGGKCWRSDGEYGYYYPDDECHLRVMGVTDHTECQVDMSASSANSGVDQLVITNSISYIRFDRTHLLSGAVHIAINCPTQ